MITISVWIMSQNKMASATNGLLLLRVLASLAAYIEQQTYLIDFYWNVLRWGNCEWHRSISLFSEFRIKKNVITCISSFGANRRHTDGRESGKGSHRAYNIYVRLASMKIKRRWPFLLSSNMCAMQTVSHFFPQYFYEYSVRSFYVSSLVCYKQDDFGAILPITCCYTCKTATKRTSSNINCNLSVMKN